MEFPSNGEHGFESAVLLARRGDYAAAERCLKTAHKAGQCSDVEALDLLGRMHAQRRQYLKAESYWEQARRLDPANAAVSDALTRVRSRQPYTSWAAKVVALILVVGAVVILQAWHTSSIHEAMAAQTAAFNSAVDTVVSDVDGLDGNLAEFKTEFSSIIEDRMARASHERTEAVRQLRTELHAASSTQRVITVGSELAEQIADLGSTIEKATALRIDDAVASLRQSQQDLEQRQTANAQAIRDQLDRVVIETTRVAEERATELQARIASAIQALEKSAMDAMAMTARTSDVASLEEALKSTQVEVRAIQTDLTALVEMVRSLQVSEGDAGDPIGGDG